MFVAAGAGSFFVLFAMYSENFMTHFSNPTPKTVNGQVLQLFAVQQSAASTTSSSCRLYDFLVSEFLIHFQPP